MRIAMIGQKGMPATYGGVERHVHDLAVRLVQAGEDVRVYSRAWYTGGKAPLVEGVSQVYTPSIHTKHLDTITHVFTSTIHAVFSNVDIIHYHGIGPSLLAWIPRILKPRARVVITFHSLDRFHQKWGWFAKTVLRIAERAACAFGHQTITVSKSLQSYCTHKLNTSTTYIPNGVPLTAIPKEQEILSQFGLAKDKYLVMISRLIPHKGAHLLIEAFQEIKKELASNPSLKTLKLAIVGGSSDTDAYVAALHEQAKDNPDIVFTDFQSGNALQQLLGHSLAMIHPSMNEGLPITVLEAMAMGKPTLLSTIPEHTELETAPELLFAENNVEVIKTAVKQFVTVSKADRAAFGRDNQARIREEYDWAVVVPRIVSVYEQVMAKQATPTSSISPLAQQKVAVK